MSACQIFVYGLILQALSSLAFSQGNCDDLLAEKTNNDLIHTSLLNRREWIKMTGLIVLSPQFPSYSPPDSDSAQIARLVNSFNAVVAEMQPWGGYTLTVDGVKKDIQNQLLSIPLPHRTNFLALLKGELRKQVVLEYIFQDQRYFFPRLTITHEKLDGGISVGFSLKVGKE